MSIIITAIIVLLIAALLVWACDYLPLPAPLGGVIRFLIVVLAALFIARAAGLL